MKFQRFKFGNVYNNFKQQLQADLVARLHDALGSNRKVFLHICEQNFTNIIFLKCTSQNFISILQLIDWRKDKGKPEDHKTFIDVSALQVNTCRNTSNTLHGSLYHSDISPTFFKFYRKVLKCFLSRNCGLI